MLKVAIDSFSTKIDLRVVTKGIIAKMRKSTIETTMGSQESIFNKVKPRKEHLTPTSNQSQYQF